MKEDIRLGHSPDSDDAFMFYAIAKDLIDTKGFNFIHVIEDIQTLNQRALNCELEVSAISIFAYTKVYKDYALMSCGASIGDNYGPMIISKTTTDYNEIKGKKVAIPGELTTAFLGLQLYEKEFEEKGNTNKTEFVVTPFNKIMDKVLAGEVDAGLIIHEGQLLYEKMGLKKVVDLGEWWKERENLPLPLGANAIRRNLGDEKMKTISKILKESIQYSLDNREPALDYAMKYAGDMEKSLADQFVGMYVNDYTIDFGDQGREGVKRLLKKGFEKGIIDKEVEVDFY